MTVNKWEWCQKKNEDPWFNLGFIVGKEFVIKKVKWQNDEMYVKNQ